MKNVNGENNERMKTNLVLFNLGRTTNELMRPELELRILDELDEGDEQAPRMRPIHDQALQQHPANQRQTTNYNHIKSINECTNICKVIN